MAERKDWTGTVENKQSWRKTLRELAGAKDLPVTDKTFCEILAAENPAPLETWQQEYICRVSLGKPNALSRFLSKNEELSQFAHPSVRTR